MRHITIATVLGPLIIVARGNQVSAVFFAGQKHSPTEIGPQAKPDDSFLCVAVAQLNEYFAGERKEFDISLLLPDEDTFQGKVLRKLAQIKYGEKTTYGELAQAIGNPKAARAVGAAVGRNPVSIIIGCHRVVGASGKLTGFAGGLERKKFLLDLERTVIQGKQ